MPDTRKRAAKVCVLVGTILVLVNQGDVIVRGDLDANILAKIVISYCVPYCVSTYAAVSAAVFREDSSGSTRGRAS